jgi:hypothetical protein
MSRIGRASSTTHGAGLAANASTADAIELSEQSGSRCTSSSSKPHSRLTIGIKPETSRACPRRTREVGENCCDSPAPEITLHHVVDADRNHVRRLEKLTVIGFAEIDLLLVGAAEVPGRRRAFGEHLAQDSAVPATWLKAKKNGLSMGYVVLKKSLGTGCELF